MESSFEETPNLPHFRANKPRLRGRGGDFTYAGGVHFFEQVPHQQTLLDLEHKTESTSIPLRRGSEPGRESALIGTGTSIPTAGFITNACLVLQFEAYFKESVDESPLENHRVRKCRILIYLEDSSMEIDEYRQENSGMLQGTLTRRHRIPYPEGRPGYYTVDDVAVGGTIDVYGRRFHVTDANLATRRFLRDRLGRIEAPAIPFPTDRYTVERKGIMSRETGCDPDVQHNIVKNDMMLFAEATLGKTVDNSKRAGFIKFDRNVLRFQAVRYDRESLNGETQHFEGSPVAVVNKRGKIPKSFAGANASETYHWKDLRIGVELNVYERPLTLVDADGHTRQFYASKGIHLGGPVLPEPTPEPINETSFHSPSVDSFTGNYDDDELASRSTSLVPRPPRKIWGEEVMFLFTAELKSGVLEDKDRSFIITYHKADQTVGVREPPRRNSGIVGGNFLSRMKVRDTSGNVITEGCFYVGAEVTIHGHSFRVTGADDKTLRLMEERSADAFRFSDPVRAAESISRRMDGRAGELRTFLRERDIEGKGKASRAALRLALKGVGVEFSPTMPEQALITVMRAAGGDTSSAPYEDIVKRLEDPDGFQMGL